MKPLHIFNPKNLSLNEKSKYKYRGAVRGIIRDDENKIAALFKDREYYSLPGGGVNEGENPDDAFLRECKEEVGCSVLKSTPIGITIEVFEDGLNITNIYYTKIVGNKNNVKLLGDEDEDEKVCTVEWLEETELREIISKLKESGEDSKKFRYERDFTILNMSKI